jgi:hypothetical protein
MRTTIAIVSLLTFAGAASAQQGEPAPKPEPPPQQTPEKAPQPSQPSLDDLLGITPSKKPEPAKPVPSPQDPTKAALDRKLTNQEIGQAFLQAVRLMEETARRLQESSDTSITTQRMQEDVIRKLDLLIAQAEKQQSQSQSRSSRPQDQDPSEQPPQQQPQPSEGQSSEQKNNSDSSQADPPSRREGPLGPDVAHGAAWGALPARVRDALLQGNSDKYSSMYQKWTEAYYRRIAEEAGK